ncbi:MAG: type I-E CRISPR-associated protein Cse1/CasA [Klebsiella grimontii]|uniref:type I-E CRISPR-associated protein Cse1/CasA n=1 Tax=Klebsiella grimontii TaxID=2058152 RepID=UPI001CCC725C|nr:type I-E CRISPR-associated protein Cse1/CasA [Klebsiella grimontii]MDU1517240.1 type I-E CRISPR-associated protein Cse1/CasA [Klebsiella michiganensis]MBZ6728451.1 type I-E CRISPR-associated protein Cse1/CasA [Klebsiella grimontii]MBZ7381809.1 type I-E CRISPR-associated protein Cse1/CasA [Klebsiella grimontii]MDU1614023.1 type I-E CRISPR-associated protein Cse1/CasA [Klebsiella michiganensis]MDU7346298.1 type I-E CRISPR-associated protein Cse1/CasA [Klebsiella grimontii]
MDLTREKWLPVIFSSGEKKKISLLDLLDNHIQDIAYPRPDFQGAAWQMLIGILQCTVAPEDKEEWADIWSDGIECENWILALQTLSCALQFGEQKPSFLQSFDPLDSEYGAIAGLLVDAPGGNTLKLNKDHFVKRGNVERICPHCAAIALYAIQTNSPAGGAGYRVGMRGGGPLTTLVVPQEEDKFPLWQKLWLNVLPQEDIPTAAQYPLIFPWLAPTKTSEKAGNVVTPDNAHPLQAYWGMPRRIELDFTRTEAGICDLCGEENTALLLQMRGKNYGVQYDSWLHPFSPYRQALKDPSAPWLALKGQPGGLSYKDWLGLMLNREDKFNKMQPAKVVRAAGQRKKMSLWCFAWDMDNAKARCWYQHRIPLMSMSHEEQFLNALNKVLVLASEALSLLKNALKSAKFDSPKEAKMDFSMVDIAFWQETEAAFRTLQEVLAVDPLRQNTLTQSAVRQWEQELTRYLFDVFDRDALTDLDSPNDILLRQMTARQDFASSYRKHKARKDVLALVE